MLQLELAKETIANCRLTTIRQDRPLSFRDSRGKLVDPCKTPFSTIQGEVADLDFRDYLGWGVGLMLPRNIIFGTQPKWEYIEYKRRVVEAKLAKCGIKCLEENPIPICLVPYNKGSRLAALDAHHRARYSGKFNMPELPSVVYTPEVATHIFQQHGIRPVPRDVTDLIAILNEQMEVTVESFRGRSQDGSLRDTVIDGGLIKQRSAIDKRKEALPVQARKIGELRELYRSFRQANYQ